MKISVIVPVYQVEKYLCQCVDSVLAQSYQNIELIMVNDGSKDKSPEICDAYALKDERVKVIHQENSGLSEARNSGIKVATGEYLLFLDSDDYWDDEYVVERLVKRVEETNADVLNFSYKKFIEETGEKQPYFHKVSDMPLECKSKKEQLEYLTSRGLYIASACNKMIRRTLFTEEMLFRKGVYSEDIEWCAKLLMKAKSMDFVCENFYCYRQHQESIRHTINDKKCNDLCNNILHCFELLGVCEKNIKDSICRYLAFQYGTFFMVQAQAEHAPKECVKKLKGYKWILKYHAGNKKLVCLHLGCRLIGYKNMCKIIRLAFGRK